MKLFNFGLGYTAQHLCKSLSSEIWQHSGTGRKLGDHIFDGEKPMQNAESILKDVTHLLISIPPSRIHGDVVLHHHKNDILKMPFLKWVGYLSATSVYGDHNGNWVDETSSTNPGSKRGIERANAEKQWISLNLPTHIFRLSGIYGPERNQINTIKNQTAIKIIKQDHTFSRIHVDDIVAALKLSMASPKPGIYNLADDQPSSSADLIDFVCQELNLKQPKGVLLEDAQLSEMRRSFYKDHKKVSNQLMKKAYGWTPNYPDYKAGYKALLK